MRARDGENQQGISEDDLQAKDAERYYAIRKELYQDAALARRYDEHRFAGARSRRNRAKWRAISRALARAGEVRDVLDLPTGTGRFVASFLDAGCAVTGADISREMMAEAAAKVAGRDGLRGFLQVDAERLPLRDGAFDCVASIRFFMHLPPEVRRGVLSEFARVSRRWVIVDYRHRGSVRNVLRRWAHALGLRGAPQPRVSRADVERETSAAGLRVVSIFVVTPVFSDKWVVLCEKPAPT
jgi:SAM-dependent methyltransferase